VGVERIVEEVKVEFGLDMEGAAKGCEEVLTSGPFVVCGCGKCG
jgi:hypothetical protein